MMSWMKFIACLELILARGFASTHLVNLSTTTSRWVEPQCAYSMGPRRSRPHMVKGQGMGIIWSSWVRA
jgi:hypothetical protein